MYRTLEYTVKPPLALVTLTRPRASNRVNLDMALELRQVCEQLSSEEDVRVAIVTGRGKAFSSGRAPVVTRGSAGGGYTPVQWLEMHRAAGSLAHMAIPTIAAINGDAIDQGLELALACDFRIVASEARLGFTDLSKGVVPWDGGTQRLPRLVGRTRALEMLLTSRILDAEEACRWCLVNMVVERGQLLARAEELALEIASGAPVATRYAKETVLKGMDMTLDQGLGLEADLSIILQSTSDRAEGIRSFLERRSPDFMGE